jgi:RNA binding exosome subunit
MAITVKVDLYPGYLGEQYEIVSGLVDESATRDEVAREVRDTLAAGGSMLLATKASAKVIPAHAVKMVTVTEED